MSTPDFNEIEQDALKQGGRAGYEYLDSIGQGDVFELDAIQALEFFERVVDGFGCHMRARLVADRTEANG